MLKKLILLLIVVFFLSCEQGWNGIDSKSVSMNKEFTTSRNVISALADTAFSWLIRAGLLFGKKTVFTISYSEGYNINFEITEEQARSLLPGNLTPVPIKLLKSDPEPGYYISWYLAGMDSTQSPLQLKRVDLFTYAKDQNGDLSMYFLSSIMEMPEYIEKNIFTKKMFIAALDFFARNSQTGEASYPHYFTDTIVADDESFLVKLGDSSIELNPCSPTTTDERFSLDFVLVNSQIYRNSLDKNVNYFNQSFINANVETRDLSCVNFENLTEIHSMLENLKSIQFYGSKDKKVTWYFEM